MNVHFIMAAVCSLAAIWNIWAGVKAELHKKFELNPGNTAVIVGPGEVLHRRILRSANIEGSDEPVWIWTITPEKPEIDDADKSDQF